MRHYIFPYKEVGTNKKIIIYGVGGVGKQYISQLMCDINSAGVSIVYAIDQKGYYTFSKLHGVKVYDPSILGGVADSDYDYVVIAVENEKTAHIIRENLIGMGVKENKIVHCIEYYDDIVSMDSEKVKQYFKPSFSYFGEDLIVKSLFTMIGIDNPSYLDIGCNHPYNGNNTALLYLSGSRGINIDANQYCIDLVKQERTDDECICCGVLTQDCEKDFFVIGDCNPLNSFNEEYIDWYIDKYISKEAMEKEKRKISCYSLDTIVRKFCNGNFPDFFDLDIEGMDDAVIASYDFSQNGPKVICVETHSEDVINQLVKQGYNLALETIHNSIFIKKEAFYGDARLYSEVDKKYEAIISAIDAVNKEKASVVIYGVGKVGKYLYEKMTCGDYILPIEGFMVSDTKNNPIYWMGKSVKKTGEYDTNSIIVVALASHNQKGIRDYLEANGYQNIVMLDL